MEELKPCPFCGKSPNVFEKIHKDMYNNNIDTVVIACYDCNVNCQSISAYDMKNAARRWNTRV